MVMFDIHKENIEMKRLAAYGLVLVSLASCQSKKNEINLPNFQAVFDDATKNIKEYSATSAEVARITYSNPKDKPLFCPKQSAPAPTGASEPTKKDAAQDFGSLFVASDDVTHKLSVPLKFNEFKKRLVSLTSNCTLADDPNCIYSLELSLEEDQIYALIGDLIPLRSAKSQPLSDFDFNKLNEMGLKDLNDNLVTQENLFGSNTLASFGAEKTLSQSLPLVSTDANPTNENQYFLYHVNKLPKDQLAQVFILKISDIKSKEKIDIEYRLLAEIPKAEISQKVCGYVSSIKEKDAAKEGRVKLVSGGTLYQFKDYDLRTNSVGSDRKFLGNTSTLELIHTKTCDSALCAQIRINSNIDSRYHLSPFQGAAGGQTLNDVSDKDFKDYTSLEANQTNQYDLKKGQVYLLTSLYGDLAIKIALQFTQVDKTSDSVEISWKEIERKIGKDLPKLPYVEISELSTLSAQTVSLSYSESTPFGEIKFDLKPNSQPKISSLNVHSSGLVVNMSDYSTLETGFKDVTQSEAFGILDKGVLEVKPEQAFSPYVNFHAGHKYLYVYQNFETRAVIEINVLSVATDAIQLDWKPLWIGRVTTSN